MEASSRSCEPGHCAQCSSIEWQRLLGEFFLDASTRADRCPTGLGAISGLRSRPCKAHAGPWDTKFPEYLRSKLSHEGVVDTRKARTPRNQTFIAEKRQQISVALGNRSRVGDDNLHNWFHEEKDARKKCKDSLELVGPVARESH